jgi:hypothetical protein
VPRARFDYNLLDRWDPFEIDNVNRPHLYKHLPTDDTGRHVVVGVEDILDAYRDGDPSFYEPANERAAADWIMLAYVPDVLVISVPLAPPRSGNWTQCRPIGLDRAKSGDRKKYLRGE